MNTATVGEGTDRAVKSFMYCKDGENAHHVGSELQKGGEIQITDSVERLV